MAKTKTTKASFERNWAQKQLIEQFAGKSVAHRDKTKYYRKQKHKKSWLEYDRLRFFKVLIPFDHTTSLVKLANIQLYSWHIMKSTRPILLA